MTVGNLSACQQTELLVEVELFKNLPKACLDSLVNDSRTLDCSAGYLFFQAGQIGNSLFVLEKGCVRIFRTYGNKTLTIAKIDRPGINTIPRPKPYAIPAFEWLAVLQPGVLHQHCYSGIRYRAPQCAAWSRPH
jgi:hypothetical protein